MALYLGTTLYRIHGTDDAKSIGRAASSGCFRMLNAHVLHLASITEIGTTVNVVKSFDGKERQSVEAGGLDTSLREAICMSLQTLGSRPRSSRAAAWRR